MRHRKRSGKHHPQRRSLASDRRKTRPRSQRHSMWETSGRHDPGASVTASGADTGKQAGDTTPEPASQHLASEGDKRETRPWSQRHSIWHLTGETGRQEDKRKTGPRKGRHTFPFSIPQVRTPMLRYLGKKGYPYSNLSTAGPSF